MPTKSSQLQIRITPQQKTALKRLARAAGCDVSTYVLSRLPASGANRFAEIVGALHSEAEPSFALAELHDFLAACPPIEFADAVTTGDVGRLSPYLQNYVAAMIEFAADTKGVVPPSWLGDVVPLDAPRFATPLKSLRGHLLRASPVPFKRRNLFVDATVGARV